MHPTDAALLALVHGEVPPAAAAALRAHLAGCHDCHARYEAHAGADREVADLLRLLDRPAPPVPLAAVTGRVHSTLRLRAVAASILVLITLAGAAAAAVRDSPLHRWLRRAAAPALAPAPAPTRVQARPPIVRDAGAIVAVPLERTLTVALRYEQATGRVVLRPVRGASVTVQATGGDIRYAVAPGRIAVDNAHPAARYEIGVPADGDIVVAMGDRALWRRGAGDAVTSDSLVIDLSELRRRSP